MRYILSMLRGQRVRATVAITGAVLITASCIYLLWNLITYAIAVGGWDEYSAKGLALVGLAFGSVRAMLRTYNSQRAAIASVVTAAIGFAGGYFALLPGLQMVVWVLGAVAVIANVTIIVLDAIGKISSKWMWKP